MGTYLMVYWRLRSVLKCSHHLDVLSTETPKTRFLSSISLAVADLLIGILTHYLYRFWRLYRHNFHLHSCCHFLGENVFRRFDSWLTNRTPASRSSNLISHSYDYRPNWTPLGPIKYRFWYCLFSYYHKNASKYFKSLSFVNESILKSLGLQAH